MADSKKETAAQAAFFDLDKTLMAGSSGMQFAKAAQERGLISRAQIMRWGRDHMRYRIKGATDDETNQILKVARETLAGVSYTDISRMWPEVLAGILPRIYPEVLAEVHRHQDEGRLTYIVSAAGSDMVESLAEVLGMDGGIGTRYAVEDGAYTGELEGPFVYGRGKVIAIESLAAELDFDLDKTLMAGSSGMQFAKAAQERGLISRAQIMRWGRDHMRYRIKGATDDETSQVLKVARETLAGVSYVEISRMWPEVLAGILPRIYPEVLAEVHRHQDEGRLTYIVSAAGSDMVESLAEVLGMDGGIGTRYAVEDGAYTGELEGPFVYGRGKVIAIESLAAGLDLDLEGSWAYSDSASDLPMLELVGNAVAVNPDAPLLEVARREGWEVMRFERLGRNLAIGGTVAAAALVGGIGGWLSRRRTG